MPIQEGVELTMEFDDDKQLTANPRFLIDYDADISETS